MRPSLESIMRERVRIRRTVDLEERSGFTLPELLVVIAIIGLVSVAVIPVTLSSLDERRVNEAARVFQAKIIGARSEALREGAPRGIRLLPAPGYEGINGTNRLAYDRLVSIRPAPNYSVGRVSVSQFDPTSGNPTSGNFTDVLTNDPKPLNRNLNPVPAGAPANYPPNVHISGIRLDSAPTDRFQDPTTGLDFLIPSPPTGWYWNIRVGDRVRIGTSGPLYTVVGPMEIFNDDLFVNIDTTQGQALIDSTTGTPLEFLFLSNDLDDDGDGLRDEAFPLNSPIPPFPGERGLEFVTNLVQIQSAAATQNRPLTYTIQRRPVQSPNAGEFRLPGDVLIDATSANRSDGLNSERSRLPIDPFTRTVDIMIGPNGEVLPTDTGEAFDGLQSVTGGQSIGTTGFLPYLHFWLAEREDVYEPFPAYTDANGFPSAGFQGNGNNPNGSYVLPMPQGTPGFNESIALEGRLRLVTVFTRTGQILTREIDYFDVGNINAPFLSAEAGRRDIE